MIYLWLIILDEWKISSVFSFKTFWGGRGSMDDTERCVGVFQQLLISMISFFAEGSVISESAGQVKLVGMRTCRAAGSQCYSTCLPISKLKGYTHYKHLAFSMESMYWFPFYLLWFGCMWYFMIHILQPSHLKMTSMYFVYCRKEKVEVNLIPAILHF